MEPKRLFRSRTNVMLGGVCGGLADYLNIDPTVVRLTFVLLFFIGGGGFWIYLILWFLMPMEPGSRPGAVVEVKSDKVETVVSPTKTENEIQVQDNGSKNSNAEKVKTEKVKKGAAPAKPKPGKTGTPTPSTNK